jgi:hypothetical protein
MARTGDTSPRKAGCMNRMEPDVDMELEVDSDGQLESTTVFIILTGMILLSIGFEHLKVYLEGQKSIVLVFPLLLVCPCVVFDVP